MVATLLMDAGVGVAYALGVELDELLLCETEEEVDEEDQDVDEEDEDEEVLVFVDDVVSLVHGDGSTHELVVAGGVQVLVGAGFLEDVGAGSGGGAAAGALPPPLPSLNDQSA